MGGTTGGTVWRGRRRRVLTVLAGIGGVAAIVVLLVLSTDGIQASGEALAVLALLAGVLVAAGSQRRRQPWQLAGTDRAVAVGTAAAIDTLDRVEHRRVELGSPWPQMVVGPAGVSIVDICPHGGPVHLTTEGLHPAGQGVSCPPCEGAGRAAAAARRLLAQVDGGEGIPVRVLTVVPAATRVTRDPGVDCRIDAVPADRLADRLVRGPVLPMPLVDRAFTRLAALSGTQTTPA